VELKNLDFDVWAGKSFKNWAKRFQQVEPFFYIFVLSVKQKNIFQTFAHFWNIHFFVNFDRNYFGEHGFYGLHVLQKLVRVENACNFTKFENLQNEIFKF